MKNIRSIYSHDPGIRLHSLRIRRLRLHRHLPEARWIADHQHAFSQILLYLGGTGWQKINGQVFSIKKGELFFIPPGVRHSFLEPAGTKPLCLALDFNLAYTVAAPLIRRLNSADLNRVRHALSGLTRWRTGHEEIEPGEAAEVLRLVDIFFRALNFLRSRSPGPEQNTIFRSAQRALHDPAALRQPLSAIAQAVGYHPDYLNRTLKQICGLTLGELRNEVRMQKSKLLLANAVPIAAAAEGVGFDDPNYFARWFRAQTGRTPSAWRAGKAGPTPPESSKT
jgi:AraC family transcriptional activator of pobA